ncbi:hypothetical protein L1049_019884 [Liquidambar formosana]|uniref:AB hydrolase-1 domain-containing protein n=1 Tax=Liquidambar formosana TaxID=63359 RepID=A0AAP0SC00_LIQFO
MSLLNLPHSLFLSFSPNPRSHPRTRCFPPSYASPMATTERRESSGGENNGVAVLWFKHDLRVDDHPGLVAASWRRSVVPLYRGGCTKVKATNVFAEEEVEYELRKMMDFVKESLATEPSVEESPKMLLWRTPFYDINNLKDLPASHHNFKELQFPVTSPIETPVLPSVEMELDWGPLLSFDDLKKFMNGNQCKSREVWTSINETLAGTILQKQCRDQVELPNNSIEGLLSSKSGESNRDNSKTKHTHRKRYEKSAFVTQEGNFVGSGTNFVLNALGAYLRYLEGTSRDDWQEYIVTCYAIVHEKLRNAETRTGASFGTLFGTALCLGFGKSEKPNLVYTELMWAELLRDFISEVIGEPVHLVGNSIGGYFVAILAGLWPTLAKSIVLINSAGNVIPGYSSVTCNKGMKDPISDSKSKLATVREHWDGIVIRELDAGHCTHDEQPEEVNSIILEWIMTIENKKPSAKSFL